MTQPKTPLDSAALTAVNAALSFSMSEAIRSQQFDLPSNRRPVDFAAIDRALEAAQRLVEAHGADVPLRAALGATPAGLLITLRDLAAAAAEFRPKQGRRAA